MTASSVSVRFWLSEERGLIRRRTWPGGAAHPEVWRDGRWVTGSPYVLDAVTGLGEDPWSSGEFADEVDRATAEAYAARHGIRLDDPPSGKRSPGWA
jgi:hypothetical protein